MRSEHHHPSHSSLTPSPSSLTPHLVAPSPNQTRSCGVSWLTTIATIAQTPMTRWMPHMIGHATRFKCMQPTSASFSTPGAGEVAIIMADSEHAKNQQQEEQQQHSQCALSSSMLGVCVCMCMYVCVSYVGMSCSCVHHNYV